jgi:hypothetical protein
MIGKELKFVHCPQCPTTTVFDPPVRVFEEVFHPQIVQVVQPIEIVRRHHCVPVPYQCITVTVRDEFCPGPAGLPIAEVSRIKKKRK